MSKVALVVAVSKNGVIGHEGGLPWHISSDLKRFKAITMGKPIIMGRKTWESLPRKPLPGRINFVVTRNASFQAEGAVIAKSVVAAIEAARALHPEEIAVIGGGEIYLQALPLADRVYLTEVNLTVAGDTHFPTLDTNAWREVSVEPHAQGPNDSAAFALRTFDRITKDDK